MNNYYDYPYQNYDASIYSKATSGSTVNPEEGLIRGNLFTNLYKPYTNMEPFPLTPKDEKDTLLNKVRALEFAKTDLNLYLDIYNNDQEMLNLFNTYRIELEKVKIEYERKYGPLNQRSESLNGTTWNWLNEPWPWEDM